MSYAAKGEKVFLYPDPDFQNCTPPLPRRSDHRLKRFQSTLDKRAWSFCDEVRSKHFHDLMTGSKTCLNVDDCHKYVPLEDLINILQSQKDELIMQLQNRLQNSGGDTDKRENELRKKIAGLTEEVNKSRDNLRKAMHKLQNIDEIVNENKNLQCRLRCSEERVKYLEEKKKHLESELAELRSKSQIQMDLEKAQQMLKIVTKQREESTETDEAVLKCLALERNQLQEKVKNLEKELEESKKKEAEIEILKKQSQSDSLDREEMSRENECYKKKLASMKCLEKQIQELKKQGRALADKYKREAQKAAEQTNRMSEASKELQGLREERDSLQKRVNELSSYECQYNKLQRKLQRVDAVIAENENLNCKLLALQKLEEENEYLRCRLEATQEAEMNAAGDKERILQLQCAVADQEEEMKDLLCQIERLTSGRHEEELERLKCELYEKSSKLKLCEEQLAEIPMLEAEIDELRMKLQCCCREFPDKKRGENGSQEMEVRFPATSTGIQIKYKNIGEKSSSVMGMRGEDRAGVGHGSCQDIQQADSEYKVTSEFAQKKDMMSCEEVQSLLQSSKGIISCVLEDMMEHQKEMEELEMCNRSMKEEIETLKSKVGGSDKDSLLEEINHLKKALEEKTEQILKLQCGANAENEEDLETMRELNTQMKLELAAACEGLKQVANLEKMLEMEHKARCDAERRLRCEGQTGGRVVEENPDFDCCRFLQRETDDLKCQIDALNKLTAELKKENELLRELQKPCPDFSKELDEKCALENLLSLLQAELDAFKGQKLSEECEALRKELKRVMEQNCHLKELVNCYRQRLDAEKQSNELNQIKLGGEIPGTPGVAAGGVPLTSTAEKGAEIDPRKAGATNQEAAAAAADKAAADKAGAEKAGAEKAVADKAAADKAGAEKEAADKAAADKAGTEEAAADKAGAEKAAADKAAADKAGTEKAAADKAGAEKAAADKAGAEKAGAEKAVADKAAADKAGAEKAVADKEAAETADKDKTDKGKADCLKQLEELRKEKDELAKQLKTGAPDKLSDKERQDLVKEIERLKKENKEMAGGTGGQEDLMERLRKMEAENAEKLKKLMEQHEKELSNREKIYNENLNSMKAGYETDIRKLAERHKQSITRLQELHDDEVQEMNVNYETQLETMQTQSEKAINDVAKGSAAKARKLAEQHAKELNDVKKKVNSEYLGEMEGLRNSLTKSKLELERLKKKVKQDEEGSVEKLKAQQARELQKVRRGSKQKLDAIKGQMEKERKASEAEIDELKKKMKGVCECKFSKKKPPKPRDPGCPLDFNEVLEKILEEGLDSLTFNEIALVHRKTCCALEGIVMKSNTGPMLELEPPIGNGCPHTPLLEADKQQLLSRIFDLENAILQKQRETQEAIISMEIAIKKERSRLQEVRNSLQNEQNKNSELKQLLTSQSKVELDLKRERDKLGNQASLHESLFQEKSRRLDEEVKSKRYLEAEVENLRNKLKQLRMTWDLERGAREDPRQGPHKGSQIELMRMKLEQSVHQERRLALQLENESKCRMQLQSQLQTLRQSLKHMVNLPAVECVDKFSKNPLEAKSAKERQNLDQINEKRNKIKTKPHKKTKK